MKKSLLFYKYGTLYTMHTVTGKSIFISELFSTLFVVSIETVKLDFFYTRKFVLLCPYSVKEACKVIYLILVQSSAISAARYWDFTFKRYLLYLMNLIIYLYQFGNTWPNCIGLPYFCPLATEHISVSVCSLKESASWLIRYVSWCSVNPLLWFHQYSLAQIFTDFAKCTIFNDM